MQFYLVFPCAHTHTHAHKHAGALLEVQAKRLTLKVGLLISRISGRSKTTIKGGVFGSEGSLASQHTDLAMKKRAEGVSLRSTAALTPGHMQADWPSGKTERERTSSSNTHTYTHKHGCTNTCGYGCTYKKTFPYAHIHTFRCTCRNVCWHKGKQKPVPACSHPISA